jgi:hypothetical protein
MTAEIHQLAAWRDEAPPKARVVDPAVAPKVIPIRERIAAKLMAAFFVPWDEATIVISDEAREARQAGRFEVWFASTLLECGPEKTQRMLMGKVNLVNSMIQASKE